MASTSRAFTLQEALREHARSQRAQGIDEPVLSLAETRDIADSMRCSIREVELAALKAQVLLERYRRNMGTVGWDGQAALLSSAVAVVGAGGLGGWVIEGLARMGVGHLILIDGDTFQENNLNRQIGCTERTLGQSKVSVLAQRVAEVNGAVTVSALERWLDEANAPDLIGVAHVVVDALDNLPTRMALQRAAAELGIPIVHGAIGGYTGQVMTIYPEDIGLVALYGDGDLPDHGVEVEVGNPAATPMMIAAWQIQEVVKIIVGQGTLLRDRMLLLDAEAGEATEVRLS